MSTLKKDKHGLYRIRWYDAEGKQRETTRRKYADAKKVLNEKIAAVASGQDVEPLKGRVTVSQWADKWLSTYALTKSGTRKMGTTHVNVIKAGRLANKRLTAVKPKDVEGWVGDLRKAGYSQSYVYALHRRLSQLFVDAIHNDLLVKNPCSRKTSPKNAAARQYVVTTEQVWALYDAMPENTRTAVLLGAFAGLRIAEAAGLRRTDVDFEKGVIRPTVQYLGEELKTDASKTALPVPSKLIELIQEDLDPWPDGTMVVPGVMGRGISPSQIEVHFRAARAKVKGLPTDKLRFHDLRHYYASLLISEGLDIKVVQHRLRHASAKVTLDTYGHMFPDRDESTREALGGAMRRREG